MSFFLFLYVGILLNTKGLLCLSLQKDSSDIPSLLCFLCRTLPPNSYGVTFPALFIYVYMLFTNKLLGPANGCSAVDVYSTIEDLLLFENVTMSCL